VHTYSDTVRMDQLWSEAFTKFRYLIVSHSHGQNRNSFTFRNASISQNLQTTYNLPIAPVDILVTLKSNHINISNHFGICYNIRLRCYISEKNPLQTWVIDNIFICFIYSVRKKSSTNLSNWQYFYMFHICDRTAQNSSVLSPKPVHVAIKQ
jgi:hypothetical protein